jgi:hypothetical protein
MENRTLAIPLAEMARTAVVERIGSLSRPFRLFLFISFGACLAGIATSIGLIMFHADANPESGRTWLQYYPGWVGFYFGKLTPMLAVPLDGLTFGQRGLVSLIVLLQYLPAVMVLWNLQRLFALYSEGLIFEAENVRRIKGVGLGLVLSGITSFVVWPLFASAVEIKPQGFEIAGLETLVFGGMTFVIARVMELGRELAQEQAQFL